MNVKNLPTKQARMAAYAARQHRKQKPPEPELPKSEPPCSFTFNAVTDKQHALGWTDRKRLELMGWYYQHRAMKQRGPDNT